MAETPKRFTALMVKNAKPAARRRLVPVDGRGLYLFVQPSGSKSWHDMYRFKGRQRNLRLGAAIYLNPGEPDAEGALTLAQAHVAVAENRRKRERGIDPAEERKAKKPPPAPDMFEAVARECLLEGEADGMRSARAQLDNLERHVFGVWGSRPIADIKRSDLAKLRAKITNAVRAKERERNPDTDVSARGRDMATSVLSTVGKVMFWYANERSDTYVPPLVRSRRPKAKPRSHIWNDDELRAAWAAAEADGGWFGPFLQFCLLTGCRRGEAAGIRAAEIVNGVWTCPASRSKTKEQIVRPLSQAAQAVLARVPRIAGEHGYIFTTDGRVPVANFSRPKAAFVKASGVTGWRIHDLRRCARSLLARAGVSPEVAERCLAHKPPRIERTYNVHDYLRELSDAYQKVAALIANIVSDDPKVVALRR
jgi:integrase